MRILKRLAVLLGGVTVLLAGAAFAAGPPPPHFHQDYFVLGFWGDPPVDNLINSRYADVLNANFNVVMGGMGADTPDKAKKQRDACKKYGLMVLFSTYGLPVDQLCNCETTYGFLIRDHPGTGDFAEIRKRIDEFREKRPGKLPFVNLLPDTAPPSDMGTDNYGSYVERFIEAVQPEVLCFDHYPTFAPEADERDGYCRNLATIRSYALRQGLPFWCFVKAMAYNSDAVPTEAQMRWQVYAAVAHGARGILYSCYFTPPAGNGFRGTGMIAPDGKPTERYTQVKQINAELKHLGSRLMKSTSTGVWRVGQGQSSEGVPVKLTTAEDDSDFLIAAFDREEGGLAVLVMNYHDSGPGATATMAFPVPSEKVMEVSKETGKAEYVVDEKKDLDGLQFTFAPGDGRLFVINRQ